MRLDPVQATELEEENESCGWWRVRPRFLQRFRTAKWALFWLCWAGALQGMVVNGFVNVVITTIERRFSMQSRETGLVAGGYDIASFLCLVPVSYLGGRPRASKPRWLGWGVLVMGLGGEDCDASSHGRPLNGHAVWLFMTGQLLHGAGAAPLFTLGVTYIDENVSKKMSSVYLGVYYTMAILGPAIGFVLGGQLLKIYTDVLYVDPSELGLTPASNIWVGAWWIGFLLSALLCGLLTIPLLAYPASLPGSHELRAERVSEAHHVAGNSTSSAVSSKLRELPNELRRLLVNPTFFFLNLAGATEGLLIAGFAAFLPKLIESQYGVNASTAAFLMGVVTVPAGGGGTFLGGYLVKRLALTCAGIIKLCIITAAIAVAFTLSFSLSCPNVTMVGVNVPYNHATFSDNSTNGLFAVCNENCGCTTEIYDPVCGVDDRLYYSPCFAGCTDEATIHDTKVYYACNCISGNATDHGRQVDATNQMCPSRCTFLWPFIALVFLTMLFTFLSTMPALSATLRCVEDSQRSFALGIQWIKVRLIGTIPAPIIFGSLIDKTCVLWQQLDDCGSGERGSCRLYDNNRMSTYMTILAFVVKLCSVLFFTLAWWLYTPPPAVGEQAQSPNTHATEVSLIQSPSGDGTVNPKNGYPPVVSFTAMIQSESGT